MKQILFVIGLVISVGIVGSAHGMRRIRGEKIIGSLASQELQGRMRVPKDWTPDFQDRIDALRKMYIEEIPKEVLVFHSLMNKEALKKALVEGLKSNAQLDREENAKKARSKVIPDYPDHIYFEYLNPEIMENLGSGVWKYKSDHPQFARLFVALKIHTHGINVHNSYWRDVFGSIRKHGYISDANRKIKYAASEISLKDYILNERVCDHLSKNDLDSEKCVWLSAKNAHPVVLDIDFPDWHLVGPAYRNEVTFQRDRISACELAQ